MRFSEWPNVRRARLARASAGKHRASRTSVLGVASRSFRRVAASPKVRRALVTVRDHPWRTRAFRFASPQQAAYVAVLAALCGALVVQHVVSSDDGPDPAASVDQFTASLGAGGNGIPLYPEPPPMSAPQDLVVPARAVPAERRAAQQQAPAKAVLGIPSTVLSAYEKSTDTLQRSQPRCHLAMPLLAAIGKVESGHARGGNVDEAGTTRAPILGPALNGGPGVAAIRDTDGGAYDGDAVWDRAVGPMQFIPSTWRAWAADGNGDANSDPNNVYDATLAAGRYLCAGGRDLATSDGLRQAVLSYNHSESYLRLVLSWMRVYAGGAVAVPDGSGSGTDSSTNQAAAAPERKPAAPRQTTLAEPKHPAAGPSQQSHEQPKPREVPRRTLAPTEDPPPPRERNDDDNELPKPTLPKLPGLTPQVAPKDAVPLG